MPMLSAAGSACGKRTLLTFNSGHSIHIQMKSTIQPLARRPAWRALISHHKRIKGLHLRELFARDPKRGERMSVEAAGLFLDYSKNRVTGETLRLLFKLARESGLRGRIKSMFSGAKINLTENRAVLHVALRAP